MKKLILTALMALIFNSFSAQAGIYKAGEAVSDPLYHNANHHHALWFANAESLFGVSKSFVFGGESGILTINDGGTGSFIGRVFSESKPTSGFDFSIGLTTPSAPFGPKKELKFSAYQENGGPVDTSSFEYFSIDAGTLTGFGLFDGLEFSVTQRPHNGRYPLQIGYGANGKNIEFGASGWFFYTILETTNAFANKGLIVGQTFQGDINIELEHIDIPTPTALLTLLPGLFGLGLIRRRTEKTATSI